MNTVLFVNATIGFSEHLFLVERKITLFSINAQYIQISSLNMQDTKCPCAYQNLLEKIHKNACSEVYQWHYKIVPEIFLPINPWTCSPVLKRTFLRLCTHYSWKTQL